MGVNGQQHVPVTSSPGDIRLGRPRNPEKMYVPARNGTCRPSCGLDNIY